MKKIHSIIGMLLIGSLSLNAAECSNEKKAKMIMNGIEQSIIDEMCSTNETQEKQKSSNAQNNKDMKSAKSISNDNYIRNSRVYLGLSSASVSGEGTVVYNGEEYTSDYKADISAITLGYVTQLNNRVELSKSTITDESDTKIDGYDFNLIIVLGNKNIKSLDPRVYLMIGLGSYSFEYETYEYVNYSYEYITKSIDGIAINYGLGLVVPMGGNFEADISYNAKIIAWDAYAIDPDLDSVTDTFAGLNLAVRWKF